jgi:hypothetical protein
MMLHAGTPPELGGRPCGYGSGNDSLIWPHLGSLSSSEVAPPPIPPTPSLRGQSRKRSKGEPMSRARAVRAYLPGCPPPTDGHRCLGRTYLGRSQRTSRKNERTSLMNSSGCSKAAKWPPLSRSSSSGCRGSASRPPSGGALQLLGEDRAASGNGDTVLGRAGDPWVHLPGALPVQARGRSASSGKPIQHHVVEQLVAGEHVSG